MDDSDNKFDENEEDTSTMEGQTSVDHQTEKNEDLFSEETNSYTEEEKTQVNALDQEANAATSTEVGSQDQTMESTLTGEISDQTNIVDVNQLEEDEENHFHIDEEDDDWEDDFDDEFDDEEDDDETSPKRTLVKNILKAAAAVLVVLILIDELQLLDSKKKPSIKSQKQVTKQIKSPKKKNRKVAQDDSEYYQDERNQDDKNPNMDEEYPNERYEDEEERDVRRDEIDEEQDYEKEYQKEDEEDPYDNPYPDEKPSKVKVNNKSKLIQKVEPKNNTQYDKIEAEKIKDMDGDQYPDETRELQDQRGDEERREGEDRNTSVNDPDAKTFDEPSDISNNNIKTDMDNKVEENPDDKGTNEVGDTKKDSTLKVADQEDKSPPPSDPERSPANNSNTEASTATTRSNAYINAMIPNPKFDYQFKEAPQYTSKNVGRGLVYNCKDKHWACIDRLSYFQCRDHARWSISKSKNPDCVINSVYASGKSCSLAQLQMIEKLEIPKYCGNNSTRKPASIEIDEKSVPYEYGL